jgi:hypothetical protein
VARIGAALAAPRRALRAAENETDPGKTGTDAAVLILIGVVAIHTRELVAAGWLAHSDGFMVALTVLAASLSSVLLSSLVFLFFSGVALTLLAGRRRSIGRDFDLACVAFVPLATVELVAEIVFRLAHVGGGGLASNAVTVVAYGWALAVLVLGLQVARSRKPAAGEGP